MKVQGVLYVEIYVGMAKMVVWWHQMALGFTLMGIKEKTGEYGREITYWLKHGESNILITSALEPAAQDLVSFVDKHGNSIKRFGIEVDSIEETEIALSNSSAIITRQKKMERFNEETSSSIHIKLFDDNELTFVERKNTDAPFAGFTKTNQM